MQTVIFRNENGRLFCPVTGAKLDSNGEIASPALAFMLIDEVAEFLFLRKDLRPKWDKTSDRVDDELDFDDRLEQFEHSLPDNIVCFKINDGISGGYVRVAFDLNYEPTE